MANIGLFEIPATGWQNVGTLIGQDLVAVTPYVIQVRGSANLVFCQKVDEPVDIEGTIIKPYAKPFEYTPQVNNDLWVRVEIGFGKGVFNITE